MKYFTKKGKNYLVRYEDFLCSFWQERKEHSKTACGVGTKAWNVILNLGRDPELGMGS